MNFKNIFWNIGGLGIPVLFAALTIPTIIRLIGLERFGMLTIAWGLITQSGLFDLGIGRATTQYIAKLLGVSKHQAIPKVIALATSMTLSTGLVAGGILAASVLLGAHRFLVASPEVEAEIFWAGLVLSATLPVQAVSATYRGINEAYGDFKGISIIRIFLGVINFLGPFLVAFLSIHLALLVATIFISRLIGVFIYKYLAEKHVKEEMSKHLDVANDKVGSFEKNQIARELIGFGGWHTFGSVLSFFLNQSEKFAIGIMLSVTAVSIYAIPFEVVIRSLVFTTAISTIAFPQLSKFVQSDPEGAIKKFHSWLFGTLAGMGVLAIIMVLALPTVLEIWVGADKLPPESTAIAQLLCVGVVPCSMFILCFAMIHALGRADLTTKVRLIEIPVHFCVLFFLIKYYGVYGAACAWTFRMIFDSSFLYFVVRRCRKQARLVPQS